MQSFSSLLGEQQLLPIIQASSVQQGINITQAMVDAGINLVEVVLRTDVSIDVIVALKQQFPALIVGAGTVLDATILGRAIEAGADFIITPAVTPALLTELRQCSVPVLPGVSSTSDILLAREYGYSEMKLFPASLSGGVAFLKAMQSVFRDVLFCPTGGVNAENFDDYLALKNVFAVGGTWVANPNWIAAEQWQKITDACNTLTLLPSDS